MVLQRRTACVAETVETFSFNMTSEKSSVNMVLQRLTACVAKNNFKKTIKIFFELLSSLRYNLFFYSVFEAAFSPRGL